MANPFDQFDQPQGSNPFDQFDGKAPAGRTPPQRKQYGNPVLDFMAGENHKRDMRSFESDQRREANKDQPQPLVQRGADFAAPFRAVAQGAKDYYAEQSKPREGLARDFAGAGKLAGLLAGAVSAPLTAITNQGVNPAARLGERLGILDEQENAGLLNTALSGARLGFRAPVVKPLPPKKAALVQNVERFDRAGVTPSLATAAPGRGKTALTNTVAENPLAGAPTRARLRGQVDQAQASAGNLAGQYGTVRGPQIVGENVQAGVQRFAADPKTPGTFKAKANKLYDDAFAPIEAAEAQAVARAESAYSTAQQAMGDSERLMLGSGGSHLPQPELAPVIRSSQTSATLRGMGGRVNAPALSNIIIDPRISRIAKALEEDASAVRFSDLRALRTWVREAQRSPELRQGIDQAGLQSIERSLTTDIYEAAAQYAGPEGLNRLRRADQYYRAGVQRIDRALQAFDDAKSGESAYQRIVQAAGSSASADAQKLVSLKRSLNSDEWGDVAANIISDLGKPTASQAGMGGEFSVNTFLTNYEKLSPRAREVLFGSIGGGGQKASSLKADLDNLAVVVGHLKQVQRGANTSNTFTSAQSLGTVAGLLNPKTTLPTLGALSGMAGAGEFMTNPAFVRWLARTPRSAGQMPQHMSALDALVTSNPRLAPYRERLIEQLGPYGGLQHGSHQAQPAQASQQPAYRP